MSFEKDTSYKIPTETTFFHLNDDELKEKFPEWYKMRKTSARPDFNSEYSFNSLEIDTEYNTELSNEKFGLLIDITEQQIKQLSGSRILEIGGSTGFLAKNLQDRGAKITLLETQENFVKKAKERGIVDARIYNGNNLARSISTGEKFSAVIASRVFEEIVMSEEQALIIMRQIKTVLEPRGCLIIATQRKEAVWHNAITMGSQLKLLDSSEFLNNNYIRQVIVYGFDKNILTNDK